jgi:hypothetical protein
MPRAPNSAGVVGACDCSVASVTDATATRHTRTKSLVSTGTPFRDVRVFVAGGLDNRVKLDDYPQAIQVNDVAD